MHTDLTEILIKLKLDAYNVQPNLNEILRQLKTKSIDLHRTKVVSLSQAILKDPGNVVQEDELRASLVSLEYLFSA